MMRKYDRRRMRQIEERLNTCRFFATSLVQHSDAVRRFERNIDRRIGNHNERKIGIA